MKYSLLFKVNKEPWNKGMIIGQKLPLKLKEIWAIRIRLQLSGEVRNLALFNLAIDSKLRACDLVRIRVCAITPVQLIRHSAVLSCRTQLKNYRSIHLIHD